jgi:hypothetical protein
MLEINSENYFCNRDFLITFERTCSFSLEPGPLRDDQAHC